jgi:hypothetical protein
MTLGIPACPAPGPAVLRRPYRHTVMTAYRYKVCPPNPAIAGQGTP